MNGLQGIDVVALSWCIPEIRESLSRARAELDRHLDAEADSTGHLKNARIHLHQAHGALQVADVAGVLVLTQEAETIIEQGERGELVVDDAAVAALKRALCAVAEYLEDLQAGSALGPVVLFSFYRPLLVLRKAERIDPADLYFPDLSIQPPATIGGHGDAADGEDIGMLAAGARREFERGLLGFLRGDDNAGAIRIMHAAMERMQVANPARHARAFFWLSLALVDALKHAALPADIYSRRLMARVNIQARRTLEQLDPVADRLLKDLLFHLARAQDSSPVAAEVRRHYRLAGTVPSDFERVRYGLTDPALVRRAKDALAVLRKSWEKIVRGSLKETGVFADAACELVDALRGLPFEGMHELAQALASLPKALESVNASDEALAVEVATAILFSEEALDGGLRSDPAYDTRAGQLGRRLLEVMNRPTAFGDTAPQWLVEISRKASERITLGAFVNELSANLASCEQALDGYFRDPSTVGQLAALKPVISQSTGVLKSLGYAEAAKAGAAVGADIESLLDSDEPAAADDHHRIANNLSALGFFVESLLQPTGQGPEFRFDDATREFLARGEDRRRATSRAPGRSSTGSLRRTGAQEAVGSAQSRIAAERTALVPWLTLLAAAPQAPEVHDNLLRCLNALERDSVLIDDLELKRKAREASRQLRELGVGGASAGSPSVSLDAVTALLSDLAGVATPVTGADDHVDFDLDLDLDLDLNLNLDLDGDLDVVLDDGGGAGDSGASLAAEADVDEADPAADDDSELLEIFLLEADEVLSAIAESLQLSRIDPTDTSALTTIRRAFHTLKGSSRMVGLTAFGDAGLAFEQMLNKWLADEQTGTEALFALIESGHELFSMWVARLHQDRLALMDCAALIARCEALRDGREAQAGQPETETAAQASPVPAVDSIAHDEHVFFESVAVDISEPLMAQARESGFEAAADEPVDATAGDALSDPMPEFSLEELEAFADTEDLLLGGDSLDPEAESPSQAPDKVWIGERSIDAQLFGIFNAEAADIRQRLDAGLADWRERRDLGAPEALLRALHSLVGTSRHVGLLQLRAIAEPAEQFLLNHAKANRPLPADHSVLLYAAIGSINSMLDQFSQCHEPPRDAQSERAMMDLAFQWSNPDSIAQPVDTDRSDRGEALRKKAAQVLGAAKQAVEAQNEAYHGLVDELDPDLGPIFFEEADDLLAQIDQNLRKWRAHPADELAPGSLMRLLHTIKGSARMAGAMRFGQMVHEMETRVEEAIGLPEVPETLVDQLLAQYDQAYSAYEGLALAVDPAVPAVVPPAVRAAARDDAPALPRAASPGTPVSPKAAVPRIGVAPSNSVHAELNAELMAGAAQAAAAAQQVIRVRADLLDRMVSESGEVSVARARLDSEMALIRQSLSELTENVNRLRTQLREIEIQADNQIQAQIAHSKDAHADFDPLEFDRYTRFQELTKMLAESVNDVATVQQNALRSVESATQDLVRQGQVSRSLQQNLMRIRMVQFATVSDRLYRVVRQACKDADKRVVLELKGGNAEIDRGVLDRMAAPIEHLLRNAVAHGIETRADRLQAGKPETGELVVEARLEGNEVIMSFSDDGAGLNYARIEQRARERGLFADGRKPTERELAQLIFSPGFSTSLDVTALAGRGVGMDVVRAEVSAMGGRIDIDATPGVGTRFTIHLPVSLAVSQVVLLQVDTAKFAVQAALVEQILQLKPEALAAAYESHSIECDGESVPLYFLGSLLELPQARPLAQRQSPVVIVRAGSSRIALHVDKVVPNQEVVIKNVGPQLARLTGVAGATVLGNGDIVLILNPVQLALARTASQAGEGDTALFTATEIAATATVMVVDDSVTVRKVTQRLLAREGYTVLLAKDGVDALRQLQDVVPDMMLVDIEMPRMDGFDLTKNVRSTTRLQDIPIIMITSRTADKHRNHALALGVDVFLGKPYSEDELLRHVAGFASRRGTVPAW